MRVIEITCPVCHAPVKVWPDIDTIECAYCGASLVVRRSEGQVALRLAEEVSKAIAEFGAQTQASVREGTKVTHAELRRLQLSQELSSLRLQLTNLQAEMRAVRRQRANHEGKRQLRDLRSGEVSLAAQIAKVEEGLAALNAGAGSSNEGADRSRGVVVREAKLSGAKSWLATFLLCLFLGFFGAHRFYTGHTTYGVIQLLSLGGFGIWWLIDLVLIATNRYRDARGNLLADANPRMRRGCVTSLGVWVAITLCFGFAAVPLEQVIFGTTEGGPLMHAASFLAVVLGAASFLYVVTPDATIWQPIRKRLRIWEDRQQTKLGVRVLGRRIPLAVLAVIVMIALLAVSGIAMFGQSSPGAVDMTTATPTHTPTPAPTNTPEPDRTGSASSTATPVRPTSTSIPPTITPEPPPTADPYFVTRQQYGEDWPFTVDEGRLLCIPVGGGLHHALLLVGGRSYALNGTARSAAESEGYGDVFEIWRDDPDIEGLKIDITPMLRLAERACDEQS